jgi:S1-C subfamily serine protease
MNYIKKKILNFIHFLIITILTLWIVLVFYQNSYLFNETISSLSNKNPLSKLIPKHPQYELISNLQVVFVQNAKKVGPSVVNLSKVQADVSFNDHKYSGREKYSWFFNFKYWLSQNLSKKKYISETIGSGLIINRKGHILTNYHVIEEHDKILVRLSDQRSFFAKVIGVDPDTDIAVLKINSFLTFPQVIFGSSSEVKVGQWAMAIGNPYGLQGSVTVGIISGVQRSNLGISRYENFLQTDASINPGNSGGPLINLNGEIIGINTSITTLGSRTSFAIPIDIAERVAYDLINNGNVKRGWIGVGIQEMTPALILAFEIPNHKKGVLINKVESNAPAKKAGIMRGDIVLKYDGKLVLNVNNFQSMVATTEVGKQVFIDIIRDNLEKKVSINVGKLIS